MQFQPIYHAKLHLLAEVFFFNNLIFTSLSMMRPDAAGLLFIGDFLVEGRYRSSFLRNSCKHSVGGTFRIITNFFCTSDATRVILYESAAWRYIFLIILLAYDVLYSRVTVTLIPRSLLDVTDLLHNTFLYISFHFHTREI